MLQAHARTNLDPFAIDCFRVARPRTDSRSPTTVEYIDHFKDFGVHPRTTTATTTHVVVDNIANGLKLHRSVTFFAILRVTQPVIRIAGRI